jgi:hypothetical protein
MQNIRPSLKINDILIGLKKQVLSQMCAIILKVKIYSFSLF